jgi:hypothetical protein
MARMSGSSASSRDLTVLLAGIGLGAASVLLLRREEQRTFKRAPRVELKTIHVIGDVYLDMIAKVSKLPQWDGDTLIEMPIEMHPGGSALNTAAQMASLINSRWREAALHTALKFDRCVLHSLVGDDVYGQLVTERINQTGVELSAPAVGGQGVCICLSGPTDRAFVSYRGTVERLCERDIDRSVLLSSRTGHVHFAAYYDCTGLQRAMPQLMREARAMGEPRRAKPPNDRRPRARAFAAADDASARFCSCAPRQARRSRSCPSRISLASGRRSSRCDRAPTDVPRQRPLLCASR